MLAHYQSPLVSFTMNIAGPVKDTPLIRRAFSVGCRQMELALSRASIPVLCRREKQAATGYEAFYAVGGPVLTVKRLCTQIEDATPPGRLFDIDVIDVDGKKVDRAAVNGGPRNCLVCGKPGKDCASRRLHSVEELQRATNNILTRYFRTADREQAAALATKALLYEACTTPKPGLVDRNNSGSHRDMDLFTFMASAAALAPYWARCVEIGQDTTNLPPPDTFLQLRKAGSAAEETMFAATGGVNTHKGAIFTLGVVCGAVGRLWTPDAPCRAPLSILAECGAMTSSVLKEELASITSAGWEQADTSGQRLYLRYGLTGIRGEVAQGFPSVAQVALPALERALGAGYSRNDAGAMALIHLIAQGRDTNMAARGGIETAQAAAREAADLLERAPFPSMTDIARMDQEFIAKNLSPGGCADLLAVTSFLHDWQNRFS
jgi:holo-ACP synthase/triphosphoribosyl-dephospho-CoA synthase